eukprot:364720-Hanusia_phi.AAC.1
MARIREIVEGPTCDEGGCPPTATHRVTAHNLACPREEKERQQKKKKKTDSRDIRLFFKKTDENQPAATVQEEIRRHEQQTDTAPPSPPPIVDGMSMLREEAKDQKETAQKYEGEGERYHWGQWKALQKEETKGMGTIISHN